MLMVQEPEEGCLQASRTPRVHPRRFPRCGSHLRRNTLSGNYRSRLDNNQSKVARSDKITPLLARASVAVDANHRIVLARQEILDIP